MEVESVMRCVTDSHEQCAQEVVSLANCLIMSMMFSTGHSLGLQRRRPTLGTPRSCVCPQNCVTRMKLSAQSLGSGGEREKKHVKLREKKWCWCWWSMTAIRAVLPLLWRNSSSFGIWNAAKALRTLIRKVVQTQINARDPVANAKKMGCRPGDNGKGLRRVGGCVSLNASTRQKCWKPQ